MNLFFTKKFRKEFEKRIEGTPMEPELAVLIELLASGAPLPRNYHDHGLTGNWKGYRDCHLRGDMVVIYRIEGDTVYLARINTHSELFR